MVDIPHFTISFEPPVDVGTLIAKKKLRLKKAKEFVQGHKLEFMSHQSSLSFKKNIISQSNWGLEGSIRKLPKK